ncbi:MAG: TonB family protein [Arenimonas sp.]|nr:TonB family protein [Arenimonas sp.]
MDRAQILFPISALDTRRIAATSGAIAVHVAVLMMLLLPMRTAPSRPISETPMIVVPEFREIPLIPVTQTRPRTQVVPQRPVQSEVAPVDSTPSPVDTYTPPMPPDTPVVESFEPAPPPPFAQISADVAPPPPYPAQALRMQLSGVVTLKVRVDTQGRPLEVVVENSSGSKLLDAAALKFVLARWHFIPATQGGTAIEAYALVPISFVIEK